MLRSETCWTLIDAAADGEAASRDAFARRYADAARAYLANRWRGTRFLPALEDALQEVLLDCFKSGGVLDRSGDIARGCFRGFFVSVVRNVARRVETRSARSREKPPTREWDFDGFEGRDATASLVFDQAWARALVRDVAREIRTAAAATPPGSKERLRCRLLGARFEEQRSIAAIAADWEVDAKALRREFAEAKEVFRAALRTRVAAELETTDADEIDREVANVIARCQPDHA